MQQKLPDEKFLVWYANDEGEDVFTEPTSLSKAIQDNRRIGGLLLIQRTEPFDLEDHKSKIKQ